MQAPTAACRPLTRRDWILRAALLANFVAGARAPAAESAGKQAAGRVQTPPPTKPPLEPVDIARRSAGAERLDLFLLIGQSNMKGRGAMPEEPSRDPRIAMMHLRDDQWYVARHPVHLVGDARTFKGHDNAGVGPGLAFAESLVQRDPRVRVGLVPCAVGGSAIALWQKGARLYDEALRRARLAVGRSAGVNGSIRGALWLQGEADATVARLPAYQEKLLKLVDDLRADLDLPELPFIACTIGEMRPDEGDARKAGMNRLLLALPRMRPHTGCVDARDLRTHIGDAVHFDTAAQEEIGRRFARQYFELTGRG